MTAPVLINSPMSNDYGYRQDLPRRQDAIAPATLFVEMIYVGADQRAPIPAGDAYQGHVGTV